MRCKLAFAAMVIAALLTAGAARADTWQLYQNDRYGTTIDYPDIFRMQPPPDADDGRTFKSADGAVFKVAASYNALDFTIASYRDFVIKNLDRGSRVTYEAHGDNWFVISGTNGGELFYEKHVLSHAAQMTEEFVISYPAAVKQTYDPIVARMAKSLRSGKGFQSP